jgi:hypothetical protein
VLKAKDRMEPFVAISILQGLCRCVVDQIKNRGEVIEIHSNIMLNPCEFVEKEELNVTKVQHLSRSPPEEG